MQSGNFHFLSRHDGRLAAFGAAAERYLHDDPHTAIFKLRQFAELLCKTVAARHALYLGERETFEETLRRLSLERITPREVADVFHAIRKAGNRAVHDGMGTFAEALSALKFAWQLAIWFHRAYGKQPDFKPSPFVAPTGPTQKEIDQNDERLKALERQLAEAMLALEKAIGEAKENSLAREIVEEKLRAVQEERSLWEALANEAEQAKVERLHPRSEPLSPKFSDFQDAFMEIERDPLDRVQAAAKRSSRADLLDLVTRGEEAAKKIDLDE